MKRRGLREGLRGACSFLLAMLACAGSASASIGGTLEARSLLQIGDRYGAGLGADVWWGPSRLKAGGSFGVAALSKTDDESSRVLTPLGVVLAFVPAADESGLTLAARGGVYGGAKKGGLIAGPWFGAEAGYAFALGEGASLRLGLDVWGVVGSGGGLLLAPAIGLGF